MLLSDVELSRPLLTLYSPNLRRPCQARLLVRLHGRPLGYVDLLIPPPGLEPSALAAAIFEELSQAINRHLVGDGRQEAAGIPVEGFGTEGESACSWRSLLRAPAPSASIVISTCGGRDEVTRTIQSALGQDYPDFDVLVVDNRPRTSGIRALRSDKFPAEPRLHYIAEWRPGSSWARNAGLYATDADIVAFADDDVLLDRSWLSWLVAGFGAAEDVGCVTGLIVPLQLETTAQMLLEQFAGFGKGFDRRIWDRNLHRLEHPLYPYTVGIYGSGANVAFRRSVLLELGGFDPDLGAGTPAHGGEDLDVHTTLVLRGRRLVYEPAALVRHLHFREMAALERLVFRYGIGLSAMLTKHFCRDRDSRAELLKRLPAGLVYAFNPRSPKHARKSSTYPLRLTLLEFVGMAYGPIAYWLSKRSRKKLSSNMEAVEAQ